MDEHTRCRLLSSVYQPFVNIGLAVLYESEQLFIQTKSSYKGVHFDYSDLFLQAIEILARFSNDVKVLWSDETVKAGWPLCTDRYVICHLGDPLAGRTNDNIAGQFKVGDFYYSIIPVVESSSGNEKIALRLALYHLNSSGGDFREITLEWDDFLSLLRNCPASTTANDHSLEPIELRSPVFCSSIGGGKKQYLFRRCVVRNGKNSATELVTWKQLCHSAGRLRNGDISYYAYSGSVTPLLDFIDDDSQVMSNEEDWQRRQREHLENCQETNEDGDIAKASLSALLLSSPSTLISNTSRIPKRIADIRSEFFSDGSISFTGGRYRGDERYALVEIRLSDGSSDGGGGQTLLLNNQTTTEFANALMYLYSIHKRCITASAISEDGGATREYGLVFVVSVTNVNQNEAKKSVQNLLLLLRWFKKVQDLYMHRIPNGLETVFFVEVYTDEIKKLLSTMGEEREKEGGLEVQFTRLSASELNEQVASASELTDSFGGTLTYDRKRWVAFRQDLERFMDACQTVAKICVANIQTLKDAYSDAKMASFWSMGVEELNSELCQLKRYEAKLEENPCTVQLTKTGDADLHSLQDSYKDLGHLRTYKEATDKVASLYTEVRKVMVKVRNGTNRRVSLLEAYLKAKSFMERSEKLFEDISKLASSLNRYYSPIDGSRRLRSALQQLQAYRNDTVRQKLAETNETLRQVPVDSELDLLSRDQKEVVLSKADSLQRVTTDASCAAESILNRLRNLVSCHDFLDQAYDWALDGREMLNCLSSSRATLSKQADEELHSLLSYLSSHPPIPQECFAEKLRLASEAGDEKLLIQYKAVQERCVNTERALMNWVKLLERAAYPEEEEDNANTSESVASYETRGSIDNGSIDRIEINDATSEERPAVQRFRAGSTMSASVCVLSPQPMLEIIAVDVDSIECATSSEKTDFTGIITEDLTEKVVSEISENTLRKKRVERLAAHNANVGLTGRKGSLPAPPPPSIGILMATDKAKSRRPFRKLMKRSNTCDDIVLNAKPTRHQSLESLPSISEESADSGALTSKSVPLGENNLGDDNVSSPAHDETEEDSALDVPPPFIAPVPPPNGAIVVCGRFIPSPVPNCSPNVRMQHMVANELILTEEAYVASLQYVIEHYLSEMHRTDLPHQLLGQRVTIFGNIEKIFEFHFGQVLPELKRNCSEANDALGAQVAKCFLKYRTKFHLYALYNKNKPKSDALMAECAAIFFRTKQLLLRDKLDLSSYLLKPVQRMGKYALMLQQLIKACPNHDQEQMEALKAAEEMVTFQLRHGNDLLAMDSIQHCDMNLKEQGQLLRQDEFVVFEGRTSHKCIRRIFLFEQLVLFTKPRRIRGTNGVEREVYESKRCIKMNDVGMTEQVGDSDLKFELWFLRHTSGQRFIMQTQSPSIRLAWIACIRRILWNQALSNRELRKAEMTSMGGNMCMDLKPSKDRIEDRALNPSLLLKVAQPRFSSVRSNVSVARSDFAGCHSKRPHSLISVGSSTSSSNVSSATDSSNYQPRIDSIREHTNDARTSSESGICCDFNRSEVCSSPNAEELGDENASLCAGAGDTNGQQRSNPVEGTNTLAT